MNYRQGRRPGKAQSRPSYKQNLQQSRKKSEFSKKIIIFMTVFTVIITAFTLAAVWRTGDTSPLAYLIPAVFAEYATATGFYYWKARTENKIKLMKLYGEDAERAIGSENGENFEYDNRYFMP